MTLDEQVLMVLKILRLFAVKCKSQLFSKNLITNYRTSGLLVFCCCENGEMCNIFVTFASVIFCDMKCFLRK